MSARAVGDAGRLILHENGEANVHHLVGILQPRY
jgi:hypothetical protein